MCSSISLVVLTKNEEININRCLNSLSWCNDVVVLDSGSTDNTIAVAQALGARVFTHIQAPPFKISEQRNWALENCHLEGKWVLFGKHKPGTCYQADQKTEEGKYYIGDVVVNIDQAERQAAEYGNNLEQEVSELAGHGILHLLGVHHEHDDE